VTRPPPLHGNDSREILAEIGYATETIDRLVKDGMVVTRD
jgi:crotonobetainyl-CoA:carnitine CoA-transferase CaiB-like acyl-CoA transferase